MYESRPWLRFYGDVPESIDYPEVTVYEALQRTVLRRPDAVACHGRSAASRSSSAWRWRFDTPFIGS